MIQEEKEQLFIQRMISDECYLAVRKMPATNEFCGIQEMIYTTDLVTGMNDFGFENKYCYEKKQDAMEALFVWDGLEDPPGPWIKAKGREKHNSNIGEYHE